MRHDQRRDVADRHRRSPFVLEDRLRNLVGVAQVTHATDDQLLVAVPEESTADVLVRTRYRVAQILERQPVSLKPRRVHLNVDFLEVPSEVDDVGDAAHLTEKARHVPLLFRADLLRRVAVADEVVLIDLAQRRVVGGELRLDALRQVRLLELLRHDVSRAIAVGAVFERQPDERQAEEAFAPHLNHARRPVQHALERDRHLPLDFFRGLPGHLCDDVDLNVRDVGERLDGRLAVGDGSISGDPEHHRQHRKPPVHADVDQ